jgi:hypothetical protein
MCTCASCEYTDKLADAGFAAWPRGKPAGPRKSKADYAAHVAHLWDGVAKGIAFKPGQPPRYPITGTRQLDPGADRSYPTLADAKLGAAHYVSAFLEANERRYVTEAVLAERAEYASMVKREEAAARRRDKPVPRLIALARELRKAA